MAKIRKEYEQQGDSLVLKGSMPVFDANNDINLLNNINIPGAIVKQDGGNTYNQSLQNKAGTVALMSDVPHYPAMTGTAAKTSSPYNHAKWDATDATIDSLYDGLTLIVKVPVAGNGTYGTAISVNGGDYHPVVYNINSMIGTRYGVNSTIIAVYNSSASGNLYINGTAATSVTGCWQVMDYATNAAMDLEYYFRPYAGTQAVYRYKLVAQGLDNRMVPIVITNQTNATIVEKTPTSVAFRPTLWLYNSSTTISAGNQFGAQTIVAMGYLSNGCTYNFNETIAARQMIYLRGTYDKSTGLFTLDTTKNASNQYRDYYRTVPYNTAGITLSDYLDEADYILVGCCYSSANYLQLFMVNTLYHFDGTNLIPYDTYNDNRIESLIPSVVANPASTTGTLSGIEINGVGYSINAGGNAQWGSISGTLSNQTDLQTALDKKWEVYEIQAADIQSISETTYIFTEDFTNKIKSMNYVLKLPSTLLGQSEPYYAFYLKPGYRFVGTEEPYAGVDIYEYEELTYPIFEMHANVVCFVYDSTIQRCKLALSDFKQYAIPTTLMEGTNSIQLNTGDAGIGNIVQFNTINGGPLIGASNYELITPTDLSSALSIYASQSWVSSNFLSSGTAIPSTYGDVGAASAGHNHNGVYYSTSADITTGLGFTPISAGALTGYATESWVLSKNYISGISSNDVTTALGYTPLSSYTDTNQKVKTGSVVYGDNATVEFVAGGNVSITGDSATNKMTISYTTPASLPANGGNASSLNGQAATYYASAGLVSSLDYTSVGALSSGTAIPSVYGDVGAASAAHNHDGRYLSNSTDISTALGYTPLSTYTQPVNVDWSATTGLSSILNKPTLGTAASMASTAFRASTWTPTYADVGALSSSTFIPSVYGDVGAASAAHTHTYSDVGAASAGHNHNGTYLSNSTDISTALGFTPVSGTDLGNFVPLAGTTVLQGTIQPVTQTNSIDLGASGYPFRSIYGSKIYAGGSEIKTAALYESTAFASSGHTHTYSDVGAASAAHTHSEYIPLTGTTSLSGGIFPQTTNTYDLGSTNNKFRSIYTREVFATFSVSTSSVYTDDLYVGGSQIHKMYQHNIKVSAATSCRGAFTLIDSNPTSYVISTIIGGIRNAGYTSDGYVLMFTGNVSGGYRGAYIWSPAAGSIAFAGYSSRGSASASVTLSAVTYCMDLVRPLF